MIEYLLYFRPCIDFDIEQWTKEIQFLLSWSLYSSISKKYDDISGHRFRVCEMYIIGNRGIWEENNTKLETQSWIYKYLFKTRKNSQNLKNLKLIHATGIIKFRKIITLLLINWHTTMTLFFPKLLAVYFL